ncbi:MAG: cyclic nucleotide-binding domain-containing protein [Magnetococcales bacterium]|nr:cyclic nucleotide-binding domain-containing protein [Magnetococcales bacterium]MBF0156188.1 cyclic nucleotide-binding domain-containing protein [Magnetococcales bacterium]
MEKLLIIDQIRFFGGLTAEEKAMIAELDLKIFRYKIHSLIIREKETDNHLFFLIKGTATVAGGDKKPLAILQPGEVFGEVSFLAPNKPRTADVIANSEVIVMRVGKEAFQTLDPELRDKLKDKLISVLVDRLVGRENSGALELSDTFGWTGRK